MPIAKRYRIKVCEEMLDYIYGGWHYIDEIYVPDFGLFVNREAEFVEDDKKEAEARVSGDVQSLEEFELDPSIYFALGNLAEKIRTRRDADRQIKATKDDITENLYLDPIVKYRKCPWCGEVVGTSDDSITSGYWRMENCFSLTEWGGIWKCRTCENHFSVPSFTGEETKKCDPPREKKKKILGTF